MGQLIPRSEYGLSGASDRLIRAIWFLPVTIQFIDVRHFDGQRRHVVAGTWCVTLVQYAYPKRAPLLHIKPYHLLHVCWHAGTKPRGSRRDAGVKRCGN